jgi:hypothetical protein
VTETLEPRVVSPTTRRRRWIVPVVLAAVTIVGVGVGVVLADRDDRSSPTPAACAQTSRQMADGSMMGPMMWGGPDEMRSGCQALMDRD